MKNLQKENKLTLFFGLKNLILSLIIFLIFSSCQYFTTEKISSETFYEEEIKAIDWKEIDIYPAFPNCEHFTEKDEQANCFQNEIVQQIETRLSKQNLLTTKDIKDTVKINLFIDKTGSITIKKLEIDSITINQFPFLSILFEESISSLPKPAPAYKRGIPVTTEVVLPIVINSKSL